MDQSTTTYIVLKELAGNPPPHLNAIQTALEPHLELLTTFWVSVWVMTVLVLMAKFVHAYTQQRHEGK